MAQALEELMQDVGYGKNLDYPEGAMKKLEGENPSKNNELDDAGDIDIKGLEHIREQELLGDKDELDDIFQDVEDYPPNNFNFELDEDEFEQVGDIQNQAGEYWFEQNDEEQVEGFEQYLIDIDPIQPDQVPGPDEMNLEHGGLQLLPGHEIEDTQPIDTPPRFAREMDIPRKQALLDLELLETLDSNIDHSNIVHKETTIRQRKLRRKAAKELYKEKKDLLKHIQDNYRVSPFIIGSAPAIESETNLSTEEFVHRFTGGDSNKVIGEGFHSQGVVGGQYEEGVEKLESLARKEGKFETDIDYKGTVRRAIGESLFNKLDLEAKIREAKVEGRDVETALLEDEFNDLIGELMQENPERGQELIDKRNKLKAEIDDEKRTEALKYAMKNGISDPGIGEEAYRQMIESENPDLGFLRQDNVEEMLESMAEEHLSDDCSAYHEAKRLADNMDGREVEFEIYDKSFENMPFKDGREYPCTLPGSAHAKSVYFADYMLDPGMQIGKISTEKGEGVALMKIVEHDGDDFLYVHSVEADKGVNIVSNKEVAREVQNQIENYADEISQETYNIGSREVDVEGIMYSMNGHDVGTAANFREAIRNIENPDTVEQNLTQVGLEYGQHQGLDYDLEAGVEVYKKPVS